MQPESATASIALTQTAASARMNEDRVMCSPIDARRGGPAARLYESCKTLLYRNWLSGSTGTPAGSTSGIAAGRATSGIAATCAASRASARISASAPSATGRAVTAVTCGALMVPRAGPVSVR